MKQFAADVWEAVKIAVVSSVAMKQFAADVWEAVKITLVGLSWIALALTIKLLWDWRRNKSSM